MGGASCYSQLANLSSLLTPHSSRLSTHPSPLTPHSSLLTSHSSLLAPLSSLLTTHYSLLTTHHSLPTTHYPLLTPLLTTHYSLLTTRCPFTAFTCEFLLSSFSKEATLPPLFSSSAASTLQEKPRFRACVRSSHTQAGGAYV